MLRFCPQCEREFEDDVTVCPDDGSRLVFVRPQDDLAGSTIDGRYQLVEVIGRGGMGTVYRAEQLPVGRAVAIKVLRRDLSDDPDAVRRFFHEAKVVSTLRHPNTVTLYDFGQSRDGHLFIAMELMTGQALDSLLRDATFGLEEVVAIGAQICQSLAEAHSHDIVHRDLKPHNVFVDEVGGRKIAKVLDFGIAKVNTGGQNLTLTGMVFGTPAYMSPEQSQGFDIDRRSDLYSLGVLLYELACGCLPYDGDSPMKMAMAHILRPVPPVAANARFTPFPDRLDALITGLLSKERDGRPADADAVRVELEQVSQDLLSAPATRAEAPPVPVSEAQPVSSGVAHPEMAPQSTVAVRERQAAPRQVVSSPMVATGPRPAQVLQTNPQPTLRMGSATLEVDAVAGGRGRLGLGLLALLALGALATLLIALVMNGPNDEPVGVGDLAGPGGDEDPVVVEPEPNDPVEEVVEPPTSPGGAEPAEEAVAAASDLVAGAARPLDPSSEVAPAEVEIRVVTEPAGARIVDSDGQTLCRRTPCTVTVAHGEAPVELTARRRRYSRKTVEVTPSESREIVITLERRERVAETDTEEPGPESLGQDAVEPTVPPSRERDGGPSLMEPVLGE